MGRPWSRSRPGSRGHALSEFEVDSDGRWEVDECCDSMIFSVSNDDDEVLLFVPLASLLLATNKL
jgi:hypothetical protein